MVELDFRRTICSRDKLAVWFAFWGERRFRPTYRRICAERDRSYDDMVRVICAQALRGGRLPGRRSGAGRRRPVGADRRPLARPAGAAGLDEPRARQADFAVATWRTRSRGISSQPEAADARLAMDDRARRNCPGLARPRLQVRDRRADSLRSRGRAARGPAAARGREAAQEARDRARLQRHGRARRRAAAARRASSTRSRSGSSSGASRTRCAGASPKPRAGCSRPAPRSSSSATSCRS